MMALIASGGGHEVFRCAGLPDAVAGAKAGPAQGDGQRFGPGERRSIRGAQLRGDAGGRGDI